MTRSTFIMVLCTCAALGFVTGALCMYYHLGGVCSFTYHSNDPKAIEHLRIGRAVTEAYELKRALAEDLRREFGNDPHIHVDSDGAVSFR